jgi:hypothetical protein
MKTQHVIIKVLAQKDDPAGINPDDNILIDMLNDYVANPITTYFELDALVEGKNTRCTKFWLNNGLCFIAACNINKFINFNKQMKIYKENCDLELKSSQVCHSYQLNGKIIFQLN